ncbi:MAG: hypothetical protein QY325_10625 [Flavobacteriales bacterium]|nr:MAG: hypothetical protein QY325_10625 [Flavobacteriales bacterium]
MRLLLAWAAGGLVMAAFGQADTLWAPYQGGMDLREGIYLDFRAFRYNAPSVPLERLRDDQGLPVRDLRAVLSRLRYQPDTGGVQSIRLDRIWGFCQNDVVYVAAGDGFFRIGLMGSLAHMLYERSYRDWDPFLYGAGTVTRTVLVQQLIDMETGRALPFDAAGMDAALAHDPLLQEEFRRLPKKQRNSDEALFRFLRHYNERHPLLMPR